VCQFLTDLVEFTYHGSTTLFGPDCSVPLGYQHIAGFFADFGSFGGSLRPRCQAHSSWYHQRLQVVLQGHLSYYFRSVAKQLTALACKADFVGATNAEDTVFIPSDIQGPRPRSSSERLLIFVEHGNGKLGFLGKVGSKQDTNRIISAMPYLHGNDDTFRSLSLERRGGEGGRRGRTPRKDDEEGRRERQRRGLVGNTVPYIASHDGRSKGVHFGDGARGTKIGSSEKEGVEGRK
jgi:hypothetical protein